MAIANTILYMNSVTSRSRRPTPPSIYAVSTTDPGYNAQWVLDANYQTAWKPNDGTGNETVDLDLGSTSVFTAGATACLAVAYDPRATDQQSLYLRCDSSDSSTFNNTPVNVAIVSITLANTSPTCQVISFTVPTPAKRYWRLSQLNADRGGLTRTMKVYHWAMFKAADVLNVDTAYKSDSPGVGEFAQGYNVGVAQTAGGFTYGVKLASTFQSFDLKFAAATPALWSALRTGMNAADGPSEPIYVQYEGLRNEGQANVQMVRLSSMQWSETHGYVDSHDIAMNFRTEAWV